MKCAASLSQNRLARVQSAIAAAHHPALQTCGAFRWPAWPISDRFNHQQSEVPMSSSIVPFSPPPAHAVMRQALSDLSSYSKDQVMAAEIRSPLLPGQLAATLLIRPPFERESRPVVVDVLRLLEQGKQAAA